MFSAVFRISYMSSIQARALEPLARRQTTYNGMHSPVGGRLLITDGDKRRHGQQRPALGMLKQ